MAAFQDILRPVTITKVVSRIAAAVDPFLLFMGMQPGGRLERPVGGRDAAYDIFNNVRTTGKGRAPATAAARRARNPVGRVPFTFPRLHEEVFLSYEEISNVRSIGGPSAVRDLAGEDFIRRQSVPPGQRAGNWRTAQMFGMLTDRLYVATSGDDWYFTYSPTGALYQISSQMPAGNKNQLNMVDQGGTSVYGSSIIDMPWENPSANIPLHLSRINVGFLRAWGGRLEHAVCNADTWMNVCNNDFVAQQGGIANTAFSEFTREVGQGPDGTPINAFLGRLRCAPWITWHITDNGLMLGPEGSETYQPHIEAGKVLFMGTPTEDNFNMLLGSEPIAEYDNGPIQQKMGLASWTKTSSNPTGWEMFTLDNALAVNYVPASTAYATVTGF